MPVYKRIVCLASSRKLMGACVAGKELTATRRWIRPVSAREHEELSYQERCCQDGREAGVLDVLDVPVLNARPWNYQKENWLVDSAHCWKRIDRVAPNRLREMVDNPKSLWENGYSTYNGHNDRMPVDVANTLRKSLSLIFVDRLNLLVFSPGAAFGNQRRRVQGRFQYLGIDYRLWVTDLVYERDYLARPDGNYELGPIYLTMSIGEPHRGDCNKLIAAIIPGEGADR